MEMIHEAGQYVDTVKRVCGAVGSEVTFRGTVHRARDMSDFSFIIMRVERGLIQCTFQGDEIGGVKRADIRDAMVLEVTGKVHEEPRAEHGIEVVLSAVKVIGRPYEQLPVPLGKKYMGLSLDVDLPLRPITLRHPVKQAVFRVQGAIADGFAQYMQAQGFTHIHTPKIVVAGAEGGANLFKLQYFHRPAVLAQSPQFYKQMMVGVFDRVFETGPVFRAEKHNTKRHLNEYTSLDFEMGFIDSFMDICRMETAMLQYVVELLKKDYAKEIALLKIELPNVEKIPYVRFDEAKRLIAEKYDRQIRSPHDLEPEEEALIGEYFKEEYGADFVFVTHYPSKKRPFYAMDDPENKEFTLSFDLLFRGLEITTGGQRIHDYETLLKKIEEKGMDTEGMEDYLDCFKYGMPPHGGLGIGLERLTMKMIGEDNVREACLFPRDMTRLKP